LNKIINNLSAGVQFNTCDIKIKEVKYKYKENIDDFFPGFGTVRSNFINENDIGIYVSGKKQRTRIYDNVHISFNKGVGVKVDKEAEAKIKNNQI